MLILLEKFNSPKDFHLGPEIKISAIVVGWGFPYLHRTFEIPYKDGHARVFVHVCAILMCFEAVV